MTVVYIVTLAVLALAGLLTLVRLVKGPWVLDRAMALDVLVVLIVAGFAVNMAMTDSVLTVPILVSTALLGFVGTLSVVRLTEGRKEHR
ncbi:monovalent cation/H+ antiporter complex subunit F [Saccharomonospora piscinae]|uniref:Sodium:proton antiporter n=1 Tax=Saccharomonospora piscinae TaxID=687388 RepID=A0A1V9AD52_SACPI|nr:monovalent cation/H+ antiporter complex subunit F [Saccharomonospora piscinae]OQO94976.1 sodium:proton antiporter [Saccharomonospora piscinae]TLW90366.1 sodium:proton antiporter [Saccharomonospora piscinae]